MMERAVEPVVPEAPAEAGRPEGRRIWLLLVDPLPNRVFFDCGIVDGLLRRLPDRLSAVFTLHEKHVRPWLPRLAGVPLVDERELLPLKVPLGERIVRRVDIALDRHVGYFPLAVRHSLRHGFHRDRWVSGHSNTFLDPERAGLLPNWETLDRGLARWHFSARRYTSSALVERMRSECDGLIVTNLQQRRSVPFLIAARRLGVPVAGYVASWDHTVGKGIVSPHLDRYVVQNETMRRDLERYHGIDGSRIVVTGWPQTDVFHRRRPRHAYAALLERLGLDPLRPVLLLAGNTPTNAPYEGNLVRGLVQWWEESGARDRISLLFRPHPRDGQWRERFGAAVDCPGAAVQHASYTDLEDLATLLQHVDCFVSTAGTILLDALVNGRPSVCVLYDEGAPPGERWADLNVVGEHYRQLAESEAFYRAHDFAELVAGVERALERPQELAEERARVAREVVGQVDGRAAERVVEAILDALRA
jgi:CDP-Glycerol:Poly(glycerophosphate) glycerophosphotransferase